MKEILDKLLAAEILTEASRSELETAINEHLEAVKEQAKADAVAAVTADLHEQWISERDLLIEALDSRVTEMLTAELDELKEDISSFRDLETEFATNMVAEKAKLVEQFQADMAVLTSNVDAFVEQRLQAEMNELKEDLLEARKMNFGRAVFEAFTKEYAELQSSDEDSSVAQLAAANRQLAAVNEALEQTEKRAARAERMIEMERVLSPLTGRHREVMEAILSRVDTPLLASSYNTYIGRVLKEEQNHPEKETTVLAAGGNVVAEGVAPANPRGVEVTGDDTARLEREAAYDRMVSESAVELNQNRLSADERAQLRRMSGMGF